MDLEIELWMMWHEYWLEIKIGNMDIKQELQSIT